MSYTSLFGRSPTQQWIQQGNSKGWNAAFPLRSLGTDARLTTSREAAQCSGQLRLYPSLSSWGHGLCPWSQGALSLSSLPASAWHYARFWWDILGSILPCAAAGCRGVLAPVVVFYYCFVSKAAFHLQSVCTLPSILWKVNRRKKSDIFITPSPFLPCRYLVFESSPSSSPWALVPSSLTFAWCPLTGHLCHLWVSECLWTVVNMVTSACLAVSSLHHWPFHSCATPSLRQSVWSPELFRVHIVLCATGNL